MLAIDLHVHESCMRVAVRVLHSCAFIIIADPFEGENVHGFRAIHKSFLQKHPTYETLLPY